MHPCKESAVLGKKTQSYVVFTAKTHQERAGRDIAETDYRAQRVNGHAEFVCAVLADKDRITFAGEVAALSSDKECIK